VRLAEPVEAEEVRWDITVHVSLSALSSLAGGDGQPRRRAKGSGATTSAETASLLSTIGGPHSLPRASAAPPRVTLGVSPEEAAARRLGRFVKTTLDAQPTGPAPKGPAALIASFHTLLGGADNGGTAL